MYSLSGVLRNFHLIETRNCRNIFHLSKAMSTERKPNRLIDEKSPYLRQHCYNPVDWYPWGDEAFKKAKELDYPIFLSVGYSTCHWCHVMERESFENIEIAKLLNDNFVSVKVDREERPDVDKLYMTFVQMITGGGGWPMSVFLTPELEPVTGGTYFQPNDDHGRTGFASFLRLIAEQWRDNRADIRRQGSGLAGAIRERAKQTAAAAPPPASTTWDVCYRRLAVDFDEENGGFGLAPKFPKPVDHMFLLYFHYQNRAAGGDRAGRALEMVGQTLEKMADGGIHDHVGKGFHRYSVDESWHVPHFEKMLYDEAQLLELYANYHKLTGRQLDVVLDVAAYLCNSLSHPEGGFFCAEDADSLPTADSAHKREGAFCVWTKAEVEEELADRPARFNENLTLDELFCTAYNVLDAGNVPLHVDIHNELRGQNVLKRLNAAALDKYARECRLDVSELRVCLADARGFLAERRAKRPAPHLDRKMLTSWNALAVSGLCAAATIATRSPASSSDSAFDAGTAVALRERASQTLAFIRRRLTDPTASGWLWRSVYADEADNRIVQVRTPIPAFADDYAFMIQALLDMYETDFDEDRLRWALDLQTTMDAEFWDEINQTGYFFSRADDPAIFARVHEDQDGAEPCANSVALSNLLRLAALFDSADYAKRTENILRGAAERLDKHPYILTRMASALYLHANAVPEIVIVGSKENETVKAMIAEIQSRFLPRKYIVFIDVNAIDDSLLVARNEHLATLASFGSKPTVYFCKDRACEMPMGTVEELRQRLDQL